MDLLSRCSLTRLRQPLKYLSSTFFNTRPPSRNLNNNTAGICKIHRSTYERTYPTVVVLPDGSSINIQYHEPRKIIKNNGLKRKTLRSFVSDGKYLNAALPNLPPPEHSPSGMSSLGCKCPKTRGFSSTNARYKIVMLRHGESEWNRMNQFCGWFDANLSEKGEEEAAAAGKALKEAGYCFDLGFTSLLSRAQNTLKIILKIIGQEDLPVEKSWRLNERHYGGLTGLNKAETAATYGEEQVQIWRRSFDIPPPAMDPNNPYYNIIVKDPRYECFADESEFPMFESLKLTSQRTLPYWNDVIVPQILAGKKIIIAAHGNSLRGILKHLDCISDADITGLNLPTGIPFVYELDADLKPVVSMQFLGDEDTVRRAMEAVAAQGKSK